MAEGAFSDAALDRAWHRVLTSLAESGAAADAARAPPAFLQPLVDWDDDGACPAKGPTDAGAEATSTLRAKHGCVTDTALPRATEAPST